ncbi:MAG: hypothetical protein Q9199_001889 [Rusavskia elegans]
MEILVAAKEAVEANWKNSLWTVVSTKMEELGARKYPSELPPQGVQKDGGNGYTQVSFGFPAQGVQEDGGSRYYRWGLQLSGKCANGAYSKPKVSTSTNDEVKIEDVGAEAEAEAAGA